MPDMIYTYLQKISSGGVLEDINELWINVKKEQGVWKIAGVKELSKFEADWATEEPSDKLNSDCVYLSKAHR